MSNQDFLSGAARHDRPIRVEPRDRVIVPERHTQNIRSVFGSAAIPVQPAEPAHHQPESQPVVVAPTAPTPIVKPSVDNTTTAEQSFQQLSAQVTKSTPHHAHPAHKPKPAHRPLKKAVAAKPTATRSVKTAHPTKHHQTKSHQGSLTRKVLASAAETMPTTAESGGATALIDSSGAGALTGESAGQTWLRHLDTKVTFQVKIDHRKLGRFLKYLIITSLLAVSGYLAWDTWFTNKPISYIFSQAASAVSIDDTNPFGVDPTTVSNQAWAAHTAPADQPRYLYLPSLNVQSRVDSVGINSNGNIDSPKNANDTAWYDGSAKPGQEGQVFINGHKSYSSSYGAAFDKLDQLKAGDQIVIENGNGDKFTYQVVNSQTLATDKVDMSQALNVPDDAKQGLTLMTYTGKYNYQHQNTDQRVVVYAVRK